MEERYDRKVVMVVRGGKSRREMYKEGVGWEGCEGRRAWKSEMGRLKRVEEMAGTE